MVCITWPTCSYKAEKKNDDGQCILHNPAIMQNILHYDKEAIVEHEDHVEAAPEEADGNMVHGVPEVRNSVIERWF